MNIPFWLWRYLPRWSYLCPKCQKEVKKNSHQCPSCSEKYPSPLRVPPELLKKLDTPEGKKTLEEYVHKHIFPRISKFERNYLTKYFTVIFSDGFESGNFNAWTGTFDNPAPTVQGTTKHHGSYAMQAALVNAGAYSQAYKTLVSAYSSLYLRAYVRFTAGPANNNYLFLGPYIQTVDNSKTLLGVEIYNNAGTLQWVMVYRTDAVPINNVYSGGAAPVVNTWYCLELYLKEGNGDGEVIFYVDGINTLSASGLTNDDYLAQSGVVGSYSGSALTTTCYYDCVVVADAYIGPEVAQAKLILLGHKPHTLWGSVHPKLRLR